MNKKLLLVVATFALSQGIYANDEENTSWNVQKRLSDLWSTVQTDGKKILGKVSSLKELDYKTGASKVTTLATEYPKASSFLVGAMTMHLAERDKLPLGASRFLRSAGDSVINFGTFLPTYLFNLGSTSLIKFNGGLNYAKNNPIKALISTLVVAKLGHEVFLKEETPDKK